MNKPIITRAPGTHFKNPRGSITITVVEQPAGETGCCGCVYYKPHNYTICRKYYRTHGHCSASQRTDKKYIIFKWG
jgi:hypothetical protein